MCSKIAIYLGRSCRCSKIAISEEAVGMVLNALGSNEGVIKSNILRTTNESLRPIVPPVVIMLLLFNITIFCEWNLATNVSFSIHNSGVIATLSQSFCDTLLIL